MSDFFYPEFIEFYNEYKTSPEEKLANDINLDVSTVKKTLAHKVDGKNVFDKQSFEILKMLKRDRADIYKLIISNPENIKECSYKGACKETNWSNILKVQTLDNSFYFNHESGYLGEKIGYVVFKHEEKVKNTDGSGIAFVKEYIWDSNNKYKVTISKTDKNGNSEITSTTGILEDFSGLDIINL